MKNQQSQQNQLNQLNKLNHHNHHSQRNHYSRQIHQIRAEMMNLFYGFAHLAKPTFVIFDFLIKTQLLFYSSQ